MDIMGYRILHISDTHCLERNLVIPPDLDMIIHSGDCSNVRDIYRNEHEVMAFLNWFGDLDVKNKVMCFGNHDGSVQAGLVSEREFKSRDIHVLNNSSTIIDGYNIWGSPFSPAYGDWSYMVRRADMHDLWRLIPDDADIVVTHGPPKGILDLTRDGFSKLEQVGCASLRKRVLELDLKLFCCGHIHNCKGVNNSGTLKVSGLKTIFSNGTCVTDGRRGTLSSHGNLIVLD